MFKVEIEQETDGRWIAEVPELPGALVYGTTRNEAVTRVQTLALRILAERLEHGERLDVVPLSPRKTLRATKAGARRSEGVRTALNRSNRRA